VPTIDLAGKVIHARAPADFGVDSPPPAGHSEGKATLSGRDKA